MSSVKDLKHDVNFIATELIAQCLTHCYILPEEKEEEIYKLISDIADFHNNTLNEISAARSAAAKDRGNIYKSIRNGLSQQIPGFIERLAGFYK